MPGSPTPLNRAFISIPKRAESNQADKLRDTFVDSGISAALATVDHQILYGRRGTGKTHALRYLESTIPSITDFAIYVDLRTIGSAEGLFETGSVSTTQRAARLLVDLLQNVHDAVLNAALEDDGLIADKNFVQRLDTFLSAIGTVRIAGQTEEQTTLSSTESSSFGGSGSASVGSAPSASISLNVGHQDSTATSSSIKRTGGEERAIVFGDISKTLRALSASLTGTRRVWMILDEWSSLPLDIQPMLGEFILRCLLPLQNFTVKIGAIEQQSQFDTFDPKGQRVGLEVGADISAFLDLDEFLVFEQSEEDARTFFRGLLFKHVKENADLTTLTLSNPQDIVRLGFTDKRAFDELVRAAEGVPRDALNILSKAALHAGDQKIAVPDVRRAAQSWYQNDKAGALRNKEESMRLLNWIIDEVIRGKRARGFLVNQRDPRADQLQDLFDARVLHLVKRGYSAQDQPGERYDVYVIDYGAYVDLMRTKNEPLGLFALQAEDGTNEYVDALEDPEYVDVPSQDLRSLRRAVIDFDRYGSQT